MPKGNRDRSGSVQGRVLVPTDRPFRGSRAVATGALTRATLHGPRYRRLLPDVHIAAEADLDLTTWSLAAHELVAPCGVLAGYSAAEVLGASCAPPGAPAEVLLLDGYQRRSRPMLVVHRDALAPHEITHVAGVRLTTPRRTATDLARWAPSLTEAVVAVDALCHAFHLDPAAVVRARAGARGCARVRRVVALADPLAESPMETRIRMAIVLAGLPPSVLQHPVAVARRTFLLDLAYPAVQLGIEYNGGEHLSAVRALRDLDRERLLTAAGWRIIRFPAATALHHPRTIAARVRWELLHHDQRAPNPLRS